MKKLINITSKLRRTTYIFFGVAAVILFSLCQKDKGFSNYGNYPNDIGLIMTYKCATSGCHNDASNPACDGLNLSTWENLFNGTDNGSSVIPFNSTFSSMCYFINTYSELGPVSKPTMPINKPALSKEEVKLIKNWIEAGAPDFNGFVKWSDNAQRKKIYVTNQGCDVVTVFDSETMLPMRYINVGNNAGIEVPHQVKVSPDGQFWYVIFTNNNIMQKFRCSDDKLVGETSLGVNFDWNTFIITDDGKKAFCVAWSNNGHIASVDLTQMKLIRNYGGFPWSHGVALNSTNDFIYVTANTGNFLFKLDTAFSAMTQISLDLNPPSSTSSLDPHDIILSPDKTKFYISLQKINKICVMDVGTETVINTIATGIYPQEIALSPAANSLFVTCTYDTIGGGYGSVTTMNLTSYITLNTKVGFMPHGIGVDESKNLIYVASRNILTNGPAPHHLGICGGRNGYVNLMDLNTFQVLNNGARTELSIDPYSISVRK